MRYDTQRTPAGMFDTGKMKPDRRYESRKQVFCIAWMAAARSGMRAPIIAPKATLQKRKRNELTRNGVGSPLNQRPNRRTARPSVRAHSAAAMMRNASIFPRRYSNAEMLDT